MNPTGPTASSIRSPDFDLHAAGVLGPSRPTFGPARVVRPGRPLARLVPGEVLVCHDLTPDLVGFLPRCHGLVVASRGPWEAPHPGVLVDAFSDSGLGMVVSALDLPCAWGVGDLAGTITNGDLVGIEPASATAWIMPLG